MDRMTRFYTVANLKKKADRKKDPSHLFPNVEVNPSYPLVTGDSFICGRRPAFSLHPMKIGPTDI